VGSSENDIVELFGGRPGWRLEPRSTPGATPLWCFVFGGKIEYSVTVDADVINLYEMETDQEMVFRDADELTTWLSTHRPEALQEPASRPARKSRFRKLFEWE
jgi:hypothetical protein